MIRGNATTEGTCAYRQRHPELSYNRMGKEDLYASAAGFGCYRVDISIEEHQHSLTQALTKGINVIDTSANYADGGSEKLVGRVLYDLIQQEQLKREEVIVVSKVGYLQGQNYHLSQQRKQQGKPFQDLVLYEDGLEHCIHPEFLAEQLTMSLERLGLEKVDYYLLHNPEYYLKYAKREKIHLEKARNEYLSRIKKAFVHLEEEVKHGRIGCYGISSNTFVQSADEYEYTPLSAIYDIAQSISPHNSFRLVQFPLNLFETAGVTEKNQPDGASVLEFAVMHGLNVFTNRPLNAIKGDRLIRLSENAYQAEAKRQAISFKAKIATVEQAWSNVENLSQLSLRVLRSTIGVTSVLMGMRREQYVDDVLSELKQPCEAVSESTWEKIERLTGS